MEAFYKILGVSKGSSLHQVRKAYHKLARQYHPDKTDKPGAEEKFKRITQAYRVLKAHLSKEGQRTGGWHGSGTFRAPTRPKEPPAGPTKKEKPPTPGTKRKDPPAGHAEDEEPSAQRAKYEEPSEGRTKDGKPPAPGTKRKEPPAGQAEDEEPSARRAKYEEPAAGSTKDEKPPAPGRKRKEPPAGHAEDEEPSARRTRYEEPPAGGEETPPKKRASCVLHWLAVSIEEVLWGCTKKVEISRWRFNPPRTETKILEVTIEPGCKKGTWITFEGEGDESTDGVTPPDDVIFVIKDKPHPTFRRDGCDIVYLAHVPLGEALGCAGSVIVEVPFIDGRTGRVTTDEDIIVHPGMTTRIAYEGLPLPESPEKRGDLVVEYRVDFPQQLCKLSKRVLGAVLL